MPIKKITERFQNLLDQLKPIEGTKKINHSQYTSDYVTVDGALLLGWKVKCRNLLSNACGIESEHYKQFVETEKPTPYRESWEESQQLKAVMLAAQEDYDGGHLDTVRSLVEAELFSDELDQARALLSSSYSTPAAVVAGVVLESKLRGMCVSIGLPVGKLDKMNADLAKAGQYTLLVQKRITAIADIRNNAAHGSPDKFTSQDVNDMINYIERFLSDY